MIPAACAVLLFSPQSLLAQQGNRSLVAASAELAATARLRLSAQPVEHARPTQDIALARASRRQGETLMIVGGAVLLAGLLVDEALISIAGVAIGGYGLYVYLNASPKRR
jgi:hypothetical protein